jgi:aryl-alcohol dehydrogenase-like predicted oxidoreductase
MSTTGLGRTGIRIWPIGLGGGQFSGGGISTAWELSQAQVDAPIKAALQCGITWLDTAEGTAAADRNAASGLA